MTEIQDRIIDLLRSRGRMTLEGNRESWTILHYTGGRFVLSGGDSLTGEEQYRRELTPAEVLEHMSRHAQEEAQRFGGKPLTGDAEVFRYLVEHRSA